ncbi:Exonuclease domain-containing protein [Psidium guajava]|nr:Exonuclease domain-containing protein [Psidium guajava]
MEDPHSVQDLEMVDAEPRRRKAAKSSAASGGSEGNLWWKDAEAKRKKRLARYNLYRVEGKFKASFKSGLHWLKKRCSKFVGLR